MATRLPLRFGACHHTPKLTFTFLPIKQSVLQASPRKLGAKRQVPFFHFIVKNRSNITFRVYVYLPQKK